jgi:hypothetical protein
MDQNKSGKFIAKLRKVKNMLIINIHMDILDILY